MVIIFCSEVVSIQMMYKIKFIINIIILVFINSFINAYYFKQWFLVDDVHRVNKQY